MNKKTFFEKLRFRYRVSILNENTLGEVWRIRVNRLQAFSLTFLVLVVLFVLYTFLITKTPLRKLAPEYQDMDIRNELLAEYLRTDSILAELEQQSEYINAITSLIRGDIKLESVVPIDSVVVMERERSFIEKSKLEKEFVQEFENNEKYNLSAFETSSGETRHALSLLFPPVQDGSVAAVSEGTVIFCAYTINDGYVIQIQHENNMISIYKNTAKLLKRPGDRVKAGEIIALMGNNKELHFEIWQEGKKL